MWISAADSLSWLCNMLGAPSREDKLKLMTDAGYDRAEVEALLDAMGEI